MFMRRRPNNQVWNEVVFDIIVVNRPYQKPKNQNLRFSRELFNFTTNHRIMSKVIILEGIDIKAVALSIFEALDDRELEIFMQELNALIIKKKLEIQSSKVSNP